MATGDPHVCVTSPLPTIPQPPVCYSFREEFSCVTGQFDLQVTKQSMSPGMDEGTHDTSHASAQERQKEVKFT